MGDALTYAESGALEYLYGGGDEEIECRSVAWVKTRYSQSCWCVLHKGKHALPAGTRMVVERAKVDGKFGTCYTCESCIKKSIAELSGAASR